jgi:hypothetical protein
MRGLCLSCFGKEARPAAEAAASPLRIKKAAFVEEPGTGRDAESRVKGETVVTMPTTQPEPSPVSQTVADLSQVG